MEIKFLGWLFIILCSQAFSSLALETTSTRTNYLIQEHEGGVDGTTGVHGENNGRGQVLAFIKQEKVYLRSGRKGKGSYGGANVVHRPRPTDRSAAASLSKGLSPNFFMISTAIVPAGVCLVLVFPF